MTTSDANEKPQNGILLYYVAVKVFLINLDRDKDRLAAADSQLKRLGVAYERVPAVYGKDLSPAERAAAVNRFRWWCAVGRPPTNGEIGCALSHAGIYRMMIQKDIPVACVMEDDIVLDERFPMVLKELEATLSERERVVYLLSNHSDLDGQCGELETGFRSPPEIRRVSLKATSGDFCAECYVLNKNTASMLLTQNSPLVVPCDWWGRWRRIGAIGLYHVFPTVAGQKKGVYDSNTLPGIMQPVRDFPLPKFLWHKFKRLVGITFDRIHTMIWSR